MTHLILGLPGESEEMILDSVKYVANAGSDGIKLQLLHILKGTDLYEEYLLGKVKTMELSEYTELICKRLPVAENEGLGAPMSSVADTGTVATLMPRLWMPEPF